MATRLRRGRTPPFGTVLVGRGSIAAHVLPVALVLAVSSVLYYRTLGSFFLADDYHALAFARNVLAMSSAREVLEAVLAPVHGGAFLRPVGRMLWAADYAAWELNPTGYHLTNLGLHVINSLLVYCLARRIAHRRRIAVLAALVFVCHPLCVETVAWLSARNDLLCACFYLGSLNAYASFSQSRRGGYLGISMMLAFLALMSKEMAASLPGVVALYEMLFGERGAGRKLDRLWGTARATLPFLGVAGSYLLIRWALLGGLGGYAEGGGPPAFSEVDVGRTLWGLARFVERALLPVKGGVLSLWGGAIPMAYLLGLGAYLFWAGVSLTGTRARLQPWFIFGLAWVVISSLTAHNLLLLPDDLRNSRYLYVTLVGWSVIMGFGLGPRSRPRSRSRFPNVGQTALAAVVLVVFSGLTWRHVAAWKQAGVVTQAIWDQLHAMHPKLRDGTQLTVVGIPESVAGAYIIPGDTLDSAVRLHYPVSADLRAFNASDVNDWDGAAPSPQEMELGKKDLVLQWEQGERLVDVTDRLAGILDRRRADASVGAASLPSWDLGTTGPLDWELASGLKIRPGSEPGLALVATNADPYLHCRGVNLDPVSVGEFAVRMSASCGDQLEGVSDLFWATADDPVFDDVKRARIRVELDGVTRDYRFELGSNVTWLTSGRVVGLRLDPIDCSGTIRIERLAVEAQGTVRRDRATSGG